MILYEYFARLRGHCGRFRRFLFKRLGAGIMEQEAVNEWQFHAPKTWWGQFLVMFALEFVSCMIIVASTRAYTQGNYQWTTITEGLWALQAFATFKIMAEDKGFRTWFAGFGTAFGAVAGADFSIWITKFLWGEAALR